MANLIGYKKILINEEHAFLSFVRVIRDTTIVRYVIISNFSIKDGNIISVVDEYDNEQTNISETHTIDFLLWIGIMMVHSVYQEKI